jgi:hypoxanthine phosphoribosyltransferase
MKSTVQSIRVFDRTFEPYISEEEVQNIVSDVARQINAHYAGKEVTLLVILKGALPFAADLMRRLSIGVKLETLRASSYRQAMKSNGSVDLEDVVPDVRGEHVLIVEDIVDSGNTIRELVKRLSHFEPASVGVVSFLSKPDVHGRDIQLDFVGREIGPDFVVGYGLDYAGYGRQYPGVWVVCDDNTTTPNT